MLVEYLTHITTALFSSPLLTDIPEIVAARVPLPVVSPPTQHCLVNCPGKTVLLSRVERFFTPPKVRHNSSLPGPLPHSFLVNIIPCQPVLTPLPPADAVHQAHQPVLFLHRLQAHQLGFLLLTFLLCFNPANTVSRDEEAVSTNKGELRWTVSD